MNSKAGICSMALSHLALDVEVQDVETERTKEAQALRRFYDNALATVLRAYPWQFASETGTLALVEEEPTTEWLYAYRIPSGCLKFRRILSPAGRRETQDTRIKYRLSSDDEGGLVYTDQEKAVAEWTRLVTVPLRMPPDFILAFSYLLAAQIAPRVTGGDQFKLGVSALQKYMFMIGEARENDAAERVPDREVDSEFIRVRD